MELFRTCHLNSTASVQLTELASLSDVFFDFFFSSTLLARRMCPPPDLRFFVFFEDPV